MGLYRNEETGEIFEYYNKDDIALALYKHYYPDRYGKRYTAAECKRMVGYVVEAICDVVRDADIDADINVRNLGTFTKKQRRFNTRNFGNCQRDLIATTLKFKASEHLLNLIKGYSEVTDNESENNKDIAVIEGDNSSGFEDDGNR